MPVTLYVRVSTHDQPTLAMWMAAMREFATRRAWTVTKCVEEIGGFRSKHSCCRLTTGMIVQDGSEARTVLEWHAQHILRERAVRQPVPQQTRS